MLINNVLYDEDYISDIVFQIIADEGKPFTPDNIHEVRGMLLTTPHMDDIANDATNNDEEAPGIIFRFKIDERQS